jgi:serine/threonine protein phosphatase PrpC
MGAPQQRTAAEAVGDRRSDEDVGRLALADGRQARYPDAPVRVPGEVWVAAVKRLRRRQRLGKYRIEGRLAEGGFAQVYKATDTIEGLPVALKVPNPETTSAADIKAIQREVRVTARMEHPNILPLKDATILDGVFVLVSPLGKGTLHDRLSKRVSERLALSFAEQMVTAVAYAHQQNVMHLDIKPENFIVFGDRLRLGDFGIARIAQGTRALQGSGTGTVGYVAPEQALGRPSFRSDVFSLCLVLYRMFSGELPEWPFTWPPPGIERLEQRAGPEIAAVLKRGLDVDDRKRFKDGVELEAAFSRALKRRKRRQETPATQSPTRRGILLAGASMSACRNLRLGPGRVSMFAAPRPDAPASRVNEDAVGVISGGSGRAGLFVADGCGGMPSGAKAARLALQSVLESAATSPSSRRHFRDLVLDGIERGNRAIIDLKRGAGCTLAAAVVDDGTVQTIHVGDAGVMVVSQRGRIKHRTMPHGPVGDAVRAGILDEEDAPWHEESHVVSNLVGSSDMWLEMGPRIPLAQRDTVILGSDGLFGNFAPEEIAEIVRTGEVATAAERLREACQGRMLQPQDRPPAPDDLGFALFRLTAQ